MAKFIIYKWHNNNDTGIISINEKTNITKLIETGQRNRKKLGTPNGLTWKVHYGDFVTAMIETTKI